MKAIKRGLIGCGGCLLVIPFLLLLGALGHLVNRSTSVQPPATFSFGQLAGAQDGVDIQIAGALNRHLLTLSSPVECRFVEVAPGAREYEYQVYIDTRAGNDDIALSISIEPFDRPRTFTIDPSTYGEVTLNDWTTQDTWGDSVDKYDSSAGLPRGTFSVGASGHSGSIDAFLIGLDSRARPSSVHVTGSWSCANLSNR